MGFDIGIDENLLSRELEEDGACQGLNDRDVVVGVHLLHDPADVSNGQTVEDVQQDDDNQKDEQGENQVAEPVSKLFQEKDASHSKFGFLCHELVTNEDNNENLLIVLFIFYLPEKSKLCIVFLLTESTAKAVLAITEPLNNNHLSTTTVLNPTQTHFFQITH